MNDFCLNDNYAVVILPRTQNNLEVVLTVFIDVFARSRLICLFAALREISLFSDIKVLLIPITILLLESTAGLEELSTRAYHNHHLNLHHHNPHHY